jgi:gliding motility-associated protein GldL
MGFSISEITATRGWKAFMSKVYGWGASVVLVGAMFKIQHWNGASIMLVAGLTTEAFIFFMSAFEPLHQEWDWSIAYPELAGMHDEIEDEEVKKSVNSKKSALEKFDELLNNAQISPDLFEKLGNGLRSLNTTTEKLSDVSEASAATNNYISSFEKASTKVNEFADLYGKSAQTLNESAVSSANVLNQSTSKLAETLNLSATQMANTYEQNANNLDSTFKEFLSSINSSGSNLTQAYQKLSDVVNGEADTSKSNSKNYTEQLQIMAKNLTALNAIYELQLQGSNEYLENSKKLFMGIDDIMENMKNSADDVKAYRQEISKLSQNLAAMNTIYGNMLAAMNFSK